MNEALQVLLTDGVIDEVVGRLKSGKEADVYLVRHGGEVVAAKIYKDYVEKNGTPEFALVVGDGREDEKVFKWANALEKAGDVKDAVTVSLGNRNTEAKATLTQGVSGKYKVLQTVFLEYEMC